MISPLISISSLICMLVPACFMFTAVHLLDPVSTIQQCYQVLQRDYPFMTCTQKGGGGAARSGQGRGESHYHVHNKK